METLIHFEKNRRQPYVWFRGLLWLVFFGHACMLPNRAQSSHETTVSSVQPGMQEANDGNHLTHDHTVSTDVLPNTEGAQNVPLCIALSVFGFVALYMGLQKLMSDPVEDAIKKAEKNLCNVQGKYDQMKSILNAEQDTIINLEQQRKGFKKRKKDLIKNLDEAKQKISRGPVSTLEESVKTKFINYTTAYSDYTKTFSNCISRILSLKYFNFEVKRTLSNEKTHAAVVAWNSVVSSQNLEECKRRLSLIQKLVPLDQVSMAE